MKALFVKELKEGRSLLIFAAVMALLLAVAYAAVSLFMLVYGSGMSEPERLPFGFGLIAAAMLPLLAVIASAGMVSGEAHAGTLPVLFGLPLSRLRIWLAMALAALVLTAGGGVVLLAIARTALRSPILAMSLSAHLPDAVCFTILFTSVGLLCSSLARSVTAGIACTVLVAGGFIGGAAALDFYYGAPITGVPILDIALWCLACSPALLLGSALATTRGELLTGFRKWLYAIPVTVVGLALIVVLVCILVRVGTGYRRSSVTSVDVAGPTLQGFRYLPLMTAGGVVTVSQARADTYRLVALPPVESGIPTLGDILRQARGGFRSPTREYGVLLDLDTGKETLVQRAPGSIAQGYPLRMGCSADGRWVATLTQRQGLTFGARPGPPELQIYDAQTGRVVASSARDLLTSTDWDGLFWSPNGKYLALMHAESSANVIRVVGRDAKPIIKGNTILGSACWSPVEDVFYGIDSNGALCRVSPEGETKQIIWSPAPGTRKADRWFGRNSISPDGRWIAVNESGQVLGQERSRTDLVRLVDTVSGRMIVLWRVTLLPPSPGRHVPDVRMRDLRWSSDGRVLYGLKMQSSGYPSRTLVSYSYQLMQWSPEEPEFRPIGQAIETASVWLMVPPVSHEPLLFAIRYERRKHAESGLEYGMPRIISKKLFAMSADGELRQIGTEQAWLHTRELGFDNRGRLIYLAGIKEDRDIGYGSSATKVAALDLKTGKSETIYP